MFILKPFFFPPLQSVVRPCVSVSLELCTLSRICSVLFNPSSLIGCYLPLQVIQHAPHVLDILEREDSFATQDFNDPIGVVSVSTIDSTTVSPYVVVPITHAIESVIHSASDM